MIHKSTYLTVVTLLLASSSIVKSQTLSKEMSDDSIHNVLTEIVGSTYGDNKYVDEYVYINGDKGIYDTKFVSNALITEDVNDQLANSFLVRIETLDSRDIPDTNFIAIIRDNAVVWKSMPFLFSPLWISGYADMNNDGVTDILLSVPTGNLYQYECLWVISPDLPGGRYLNTVDEIGNSNIYGNTDFIDISISPNGEKIVTSPSFLRVGNEHYDHEYHETKHEFRWNGVVFEETLEQK